MSLPLVSIGLPIFNSKTKITKVLKSIFDHLLNQRYYDYLYMSVMID